MSRRPPARPVVSGGFTSSTVASAIAAPTVPVLGQRPAVQPGWVLLQSVAPRASLNVPCDGGPRPTGGAGGWTGRARARRTAYVGFEGTDIEAWELTLVLGSIAANRSIERDVKQLILLTRPSDASEGRSPVIACYGPSPLRSRLVVCGQVARGEIEHADDGVTRISQDVTLTLLAYGDDEDPAGVVKVQQEVTDRARRGVDDAEAERQAAAALAASQARARRR